MRPPFFPCASLLGLTVLIVSWISPASLPAQGTLTPPGAPAATMRSLDQVEPRIPITTALPSSIGAQFIISAAGSYYLTGNLTGVSGKVCISVTVSDVTIDLGGFTLIGVTGASSAIACTNLDRIHIRNGRIRNWPATGLNGNGGDGTRLESVVCEANGGQGAIVGENAVVTDCMFRNNTGASGHGLQIGNGSVVHRCTSRGNAQNGFVIGSDCAVTDCAALSNGEIGFSVASASRLQGCTATSNGAAGFSSLGLAPIFFHCTARMNTGAGVEVGSDALITQCTAHQNAHGIVCGSGSVVTGCNVSTNTPAGTTAASGAGIRVTGVSARIEGNISRGNNRGYETTVTDVLLIRNLADGNGTNYSITGDGAGVLVTAPNVDTATNPHANFSF